MNVKPLGEYVLVRVLPHRKASPIISPSGIAPIEVGEVLDIGPRVKDLRVGAYVAFHHAHLDAAKQSRQLRTLINDDNRDIFLLKWFDILFEVETLEGVEIQGETWASLPSSFLFPRVSRSGTCRRRSPGYSPGCG